MKSALVTGSILAATLWTGMIHAQSFDLPDPGVIKEDVAFTPQVARTSSDLYAGSLRLNDVSRRAEGSTWRLVLASPVRISRLDLRILSGRVQIRQVLLTTAGGAQIPVQDLSNTATIETDTWLRSENISLNEDVVELTLTAEAFSEGAALFVTALSPVEVPKLSVWAPAQSSVPSYVPGVQVSKPGQRVSIVINPKKTSCQQGFCVNDIVIFQRQRAKILEVHSDGRVLIIQRGTRRVMTRVSEIQRPLLPPYGG